MDIWFVAYYRTMQVPREQSAGLWQRLQSGDAPHEFVSGRPGSVRDASRVGAAR